MDAKQFFSKVCAMRKAQRAYYNSLSNLMPACRACNFYKSVYTVEQFRNRIKEELAHTCIRTFQTRLAMQYGIVSYHKWDGRFYFENLKNNEI